MEVTLIGELFPNRKARNTLDKLMRTFNACKRYAYKRLLEGRVRKELKKELQPIFTLNSRYVDDAIMQAQATLDAMLELKRNPKKIIWGGKKLFNDLQKAKKGNDTEKIATLEEEWQDKRTGSIYSRGDKSKKGNLNLRINIDKKKKLWLRITQETRTWINIPLFLGKKYRKKIMTELAQKKPLYSVELLRREGRYFIHITVEEILPQEKIGFEEGSIGIDLNAFPAHIAWTEIDKEGNLRATGKIATPHLYDSRKNKREWWRGEYANRLIKLSQEKNKALVLENLDFPAPKKKYIKRRKLRRILSNFSYSSQKKAIVRQCGRKGVKTKEVCPKYTSIVGNLKYRKKCSLTIHQAAAMVIARKGIEYKEKLSKELYQEAVGKKIINCEMKDTKQITAKELHVKWQVWSQLNKKRKQKKKRIK